MKNIKSFRVFEDGKIKSLKHKREDEKGESEVDKFAELVEAIAHLSDVLVEFDDVKFDDEEDPYDLSDDEKEILGAMKEHLDEIKSLKSKLVGEEDEDDVEHVLSESKFGNIYEEKGGKWIKDAIKRPGALRKKMGKGAGDKISKYEIEEEISKLKKKDKNTRKPGVQGLSKRDLTKFKQLNLAKTLKNFK